MRARAHARLHHVTVACCCVWCGPFPRANGGGGGAPQQLCASPVYYMWQMRCSALSHGGVTVNVQ